MSEAKILVVYYSRTGTTRLLGSAIAEMLGADLEEICDCSDREGAGGYLRSLIDAIRKAPAEIVPVGLDVSAYDLVVIGSPVWAGSVSSPVRSYLLDSRARLPQVAFFCSFGGHGADTALREMRELAGKPSIAECYVTAAAVHQGVHSAIASFVSGLKKRLARSGEMEWMC